MDKYKYSYEWTPNYCYKDTDILINKLNIKNEKDLFNAERTLVTLRTNELFDNPVKGNFDFKHLKSIHKYLFQDIYRWAGEVRNCNIAKSDLFCLSEYIDNYADDIFSKLKENNYYLNYNYDKKIEQIVKLFSDINALHPFREGNGRTQREFIEQLAYINGINLDLTNVSQKQMIEISHESILGNYDNMITIFKNNSNKISKEEQINKIKNIISSDKLKNKMLNIIIDN